jgi:hypothetical protein
MLIDPQNINATVHVIRYSDRNKELGSRDRIWLCAWMLVVLFVPISDISLHADPTLREFYFLFRGFSISGNSLTQNRMKIPIKARE